MSETPLKSFIDYKAQTNMQCGNYSVEIPKPKSSEQYRFHFNMEVCIGCHCCEVACNEQNANPSDVKWRRVGEKEVGEFPDMMQLFNSMSCNHCIDPACLKGCPTNSYIKFDNGIVFHDDETCIGCQYCTWNCPYEVPVFDKSQGIVTKCHMCHEKLDAGQTPACVQACPSGAIEIEVVDVQKWVDEQMSSEGVAPNLIDVNVTKPTTRYTLPTLEKTPKPLDEHILKPAHSELPLVFMTVLTQLSVGGFLALFLGQLLYILGLDLPKPDVAMLIAVLIPAAIGLPLSALHLGRPLLAMSAMKNLKTSWLSREALALGVFVTLLVPIGVMLLFDVGSFVILILSAVTLSIGVYGIYAQSMIYRVPARPSWDRESTTMMFIGSGYVGFLLIALVLLFNSSSSAASAILSFALMFALFQTYLIHNEIQFYKTLSSEHKSYYQLNRTRGLFKEIFKKELQIRVYTIVIFAILLPLLAIVLIASKSFFLATILLLLSLIGSLASELLGRYLFYATVVPYGLAGNFFTGRSRG